MPLAHVPCPAANAGLPARHQGSRVEGTTAGAVLAEVALPKELEMTPANYGQGIKKPAKVLGNQGEKAQLI